MTQQVERPYDAEAEYLENSEEGGGKAFIDTGIVANGVDNTFDIEFEGLSITGENWIFGIYQDNSHKCYGINFLRDHTLRCFNGCQSVGNRFITPISLNTKYIARFEGNGTCTINDILGKITPQLNLSDPVQNLYLFSILYEGVVDYFSNCRIYSFKWSKGTTAVLDLIPVRIGSEGYMYDRVSGKLFGNSGTGHFILGPDVA